MTVVSTPSPVPTINGKRLRLLCQRVKPSNLQTLDPSLKTTASVQTHVNPEAPNHSAPNAQASSVILQFQRLMNRFLETQQQVMLAYLQKKGDEPALSSPQLSSATASDASTVPNLRPTALKPCLPPQSPPLNKPCQSLPQQPPLLRLLLTVTPPMNLSRLRNYRITLARSQ